MYFTFQTDGTYSKIVVAKALNSTSYLAQLPSVTGYMFDVTRDDGLSFHATTVNLKVRPSDATPYRRRRQR
jgi:hypothetical protein